MWPLTRPTAPPPFKCRGAGIPAERPIGRKQWVNRDPFRDNKKRGKEQKNGSDAIKSQVRLIMPDFDKQSFWPRVPIGL